MSCTLPKLAVFTSQLGASFINKHSRDILPGRTVVVAKYKTLSAAGSWDGHVPTFCLDKWKHGLLVRLARRAGISEARMRDVAIARFLRQNGVSAVLGEFLDEFVEFVPLLDRLQIPYVVQSHGMDASARIRVPEIARSYIAFKSATAILTRCELHRTRLIKVGLPSEKVHVSIGGIDVPLMPQQRNSSACRRFLAIGYMTSKKSPIYLLESFRRALVEDGELSLDYVGGGPLLPAAKHFVAACGLAHKVRLHGIVSDAIRDRLLKECGVFVQHSITDPDTGDEEGLPASIQEAFAHSLAVVSTRHAGIPDAVKEGINGLLVDEGDVEGMARAMIQIIPNAEVMGAVNHLEALRRHEWRFERDRLLNALGLPIETSY